VANARRLSLESRLVAPADGTLNFAGVYSGGSLQQVSSESQLVAIADSTLNFAGAYSVGTLLQVS